MTNEQLTAYLQDESYLYTLSYEELKTLVVQYPYASNMRMLLLKKSYIEQNKDYDRNLQMASAYSTDRRFLYKIIKRLKALQIIPENVILGEDFLELSSLSDLHKVAKEKQTVEMSAIAENTKTLSANFFLDFETPTQTAEDEEALFDMIISSNKDTDFDNLTDDEVDDLVENIVQEFQTKQNGVHPTISSENGDIQNAINSTEDIDIQNFITNSTSLNNSEDAIIENEILKLDTFNNEHKSENIVTEFLPNTEGVTETDTEVEEIETILVEDIQADNKVSESSPNTEGVSETDVEHLIEADSEIIDIQGFIPNDEPEETTIPETESISESDSLIELDEEWASISENEDIHHGIEEIHTTFVESIEVGTENKEDDIVFSTDSSIKQEHVSYEKEQELVKFITQKPQDIISFSQNHSLSFGNEQVEDMKKPEIELEIVNQSKATLVDSEPKAYTASSKLSFAEWLQQFKVVSGQSQVKPVEVEIVVDTAEETIAPQVETPVIVENLSDNHAPIGYPSLPDKDTITELPTVESRQYQKESMANLFEASDDLPNNFWGLSDESSNTPKLNVLENTEAVFDEFLRNKQNGTEIDLDKVADTEGVKKVEDISANNIEEYSDDEDDDYEDELLQKKKKMHAWAEASLEEDEELVSETFANMLEKQGNYKKAIEMYERLSLQIPEKSSFFAAKIKELRIKIISIF